MYSSYLQNLLNAIDVNHTPLTFLAIMLSLSILPKMETIPMHRSVSRLFHRHNNSEVRS